MDRPQEHAAIPLNVQVKDVKGVWVEVTQYPLLYSDCINPSTRGPLAWRFMPLWEGLDKNE